MKTTLQIWLVQDGKPGHINQSAGLAEAVANMHCCGIHAVDLDHRDSMPQRLSAAAVAARELPAPDLIIGCGHKTHMPLWSLSRRYRAMNVVIMRPTMPLTCFDLCIAPRHDFADGAVPSRVLLTRGALHRRVAATGRSEQGLILLGGPSKNHGWDEDSLINRLAAITTEGRWTIGDSRRTPDGLLEKIRSRFPGLETVPHQETTRDWLPRQLASAREIWVTEDSVSMIHEAVGSGARVGILPVPRRRPKSRVIRGLEALTAEGAATTFDRWLETGRLANPLALPDEAERCATAVLERLAARQSGPTSTLLRPVLSRRLVSQL